MGTRMPWLSSCACSNCTCAVLRLRECARQEGLGNRLAAFVVAPVSGASSAGAGRFCTDRQPTTWGGADCDHDLLTRAVSIGIVCNALDTG